MARYTVAFLMLLSGAIAATGSTASDVENGVCRPITLIFARGTTEPGNMGTVVGPPLADGMIQAFGANNVAVQGVNYPADIAGAISGATDPQGATGSKNMAMFSQKVATACPSSKVVLSGYSQGAEQVRGALMNLGAQNNVAAAVTFGDPLQSTQFVNIAKANTKVYCNQGDPVCMEMFVITAAHLAYGTNGDIMSAVNFIQSVINNSSTTST
ncbi:uncharacterized protein PV09_03346 [Verruconis gallopava]|uniref:Cutinase n=1 Tax=Verruconis gallopava TaxID=253628 RepID=A0A0D1YXM5_9PEZI|nr:uncharacterized protein PV09_03346 [Verruconis gallopava]KIW05457.1 hypothetical protein PV09_03346 [Verruconis gallopava]